MKLKIYEVPHSVRKDLASLTRLIYYNCNCLLMKIDILRLMIFISNKIQLVDDRIMFETMFTFLLHIYHYIPKLLFCA